MEKNTVFILIVYDCQEYRRRYPKYSVCERSRFYCSSLQGAEQLIGRILDPDDELNSHGPVHHFLVEEIAYDTPDYKYTCRRLYDHQGNLIDQTLCHGYSDHGAYKGRPYSMMRFNIGDIVEIFNEYTKSVELGFVVHCPIDLRMGQLIKSLDDSDDCYVVLTDHRYMESHQHVSPLDLFKPLFKIPVQTQKRLEKEFDKFQREESDYYKKEYDGKSLMLTDEQYGDSLYFAKREKRQLPFDCSLVDDDGKVKMAFVVESIDDKEKGKAESLALVVNVV